MGPFPAGKYIEMVKKKKAITLVKSNDFRYFVQFVQFVQCISIIYSCIASIAALLNSFTLIFSNKFFCHFV